jgi:hypothetical protein
MNLETAEEIRKLKAEYNKYNTIYLNMKTGKDLSNHNCQGGDCRLYDLFYRTELKEVIMKFFDNKLKAIEDQIEFFDVGVHC